MIINIEVGGSGVERKTEPGVEDLTEGSTVPVWKMGADCHECGENSKSEEWDPPKRGFMVKQWQKWHQNTRVTLSHLPLKAGHWRECHFVLERPLGETVSSGDKGDRGEIP